MSAAEWYERIKVRPTTDPARWYVADTITGELDPAVRRYVDSLLASRRQAKTIENRCYLLRHFIVYLRSKNLSLAKFARSPLHHANFASWLANPYRTNPSTVVLPFEKSDLRGALSESTQTQILVATRHLLNVEDAWSTAQRQKATVSRLDGKASVQEVQDAESVAVAPLIPLRRQKRTRPKTYSNDLFAQLLEHCTYVRDKAILSILYEGGPRLGELLGMRLCDLDFSGGGIFIRSRNDNPNGATLKTRERGERLLLLPYDVMALCELYIVKERASITQHDMLWINLARQPSGLYGSPLKKSGVYSLFRRLKAELGLKTMHPHMSRHTHATELAKSEDIGFVARRLGISVEIARSTYVHPDNEETMKQYERYRASKLERESTHR